MPATKTLQKFLNENKDIINNNNFETFFNNVEKELDVEKWNLLLQAMQKADIDFLPYIHYVPENYLKGNKEVTEVKIPEGIKNIRYGAFVECSNLKTIYLPSTLQKIELNVFAKCNSLKKVYYNGTKHQWREIYKTVTGNEPLFESTINCTDGDVKYYINKYGSYMAEEN